MIYSSDVNNGLTKTIQESWFSQFYDVSLLRNSSANLR